MRRLQHFNRGNATLYLLTEIGSKGCYGFPSFVHFSISPTTCKDQAAKAVAAFAGVCRRNLRLRNHLLVAVHSITENLNIAKTARSCQSSSFVFYQVFNYYSLQLLIDCPIIQFLFHLAKTIQFYKQILVFRFVIVDQVTSVAIVKQYLPL